MSKLYEGQTPGGTTYIISGSESGNVWMDVPGKFVGLLSLRVVGNAVRTDKGIIPIRPEDVQPISKVLTAHRAAHASKASTERSRIEVLFDRAVAAQDATDDDNLDRHFRLQEKAEAALAAWREKYPEAAAAEDARKTEHAATEKARREEDFRHSFIGRGLD